MLEPPKDQIEVGERILACECSLRFRFAWILLLFFFFWPISRLFVFLCSVGRFLFFLSSVRPQSAGSNHLTLHLLSFNSCGVGFASSGELLAHLVFWFGRVRDTAVCRLIPTSAVGCCCGTFYPDPGSFLRRDFGVLIRSRALSFCSILTLLALCCLMPDAPKGAPRAE